MDKKLMNKMNDMELDKASGGRCNPGGSKKRPRPGFHDSNANSMAANVDVDETQTAWWKKVAKIKPD
jgi:hypothetical protein